MNKFKLGDRVLPLVNDYPEHEGRIDLVVMHLEEDCTGAGVGPEGNDPEKHHDPDHGYLWYHENELKVLDW